MIRQVMKLASTVVCVVAVAIIAVEREGKKGEEKKREAIEAVRNFKQNFFSKHEKAPRWMVEILFSDVVLEWMMDWLVSIANKEGIFVHTAQGNGGDD